MKQSKAFSIGFFCMAALATMYTIYQQRMSRKFVSSSIDMPLLSNSLINSSVSSLPLVYISTREGLTSRIRQLEIIYSNAQLFNRNITLVNMPSVHYKQVGPINLCKLFVLPSTIECVSVEPEEVTHSFNCTLPYSPENKDSRWLYKPHNFGLRTFDHLLPGSAFSWNLTSCALIWGFYYDLKPQYSFSNIRFQSKYVQLFQSGLRHMRMNSYHHSASVRRALRSAGAKVAGKSGNSTGSINSAGISTSRVKNATKNELPFPKSITDPVSGAGTADSFARPLWAFHWRRGDQADRCRRSEDNSVNCLPAAALVNLILETVRNHTTASSNQTMVNPLPVISAHSSLSNVLVYVATNENDPEALRTLRSAGFKTYDDLGLSRRSQLNALERFVVEVQIMVHAERFFGWGTSGVHAFVDRLRNQRISG